MKWYKVYLNGENQIWKKCITYSWEFMHENEEINFQEIIGSSSKKECQIKALVKGKGLTAKSISDFEQIRMPEFAEVSHLFLISEKANHYLFLKRIAFMEKYKVDYSEFSYFKGITIDFDSLEEGLDYAQRHNIKDVLVRSEKNDIKRVVNFDFLNGRDFIQTFHWIVSLSKRSNITGLYHLSKLKDFRWGVDNNFDLDLSLFPVLEKVNISYDAKISGWEMLHQLNWLQLSKVRTDNLSFLEKTISLQYLRIIGGSFTSIEGLEKCVNLKTLFLQRCTALTNLKPTIANLYNLERLNLETCRKVSVEELKGIAVRYISVI